MASDDRETQKPGRDGLADAPFTQEAVDWFVRLQAAEGDPQIARAFRSWSESDPRHAAAFEKVAEMWGAPEFDLAASKVARETGFAAPRLKEGRGGSLARKAGTGIAIFIIAFGITKGPDILLRLRADYVTGIGEQRIIALPDGSRMTMNTKTAVALDFGGGRRNVNILEGEAYFDVRHDPGHPFRVTGHFGRVEVTGTAFDVQTRDAVDNVVLSRGHVQVTRLSQHAERADLIPDEAVDVTGSALSPIRKIDTSESLAWLDGRISFSSRPFGEVLENLRRYYAGRIFVIDGHIKQVAVSGNYKLDHPALVIQSLAEAAGASMTTLPGGIIILH